MAIIGNICKYSIRLNAKQAALKGLSFSGALSILNGDETVLCQYPNHEDIEDFVEPAYRDVIACVPTLWAGSWAPTLDSTVTDLRCRQERRVLSSNSIGERERNTQGWLWQMDQFIDMRTLKNFFSNPDENCPQTSIKSKDVDTAVRQMFWWRVLELMTHRGLWEIAEVIWPNVRPEIGRRAKDQRIRLHKQCLCPSAVLSRCSYLSKRASNLFERSRPAHSYD
jgi:hypothetical protein